MVRLLIYSGFVATFFITPYRCLFVHEHSTITVESLALQVRLLLEYLSKVTAHSDSIKVVSEQKYSYPDFVSTDRNFVAAFTI